MTPVRAKAENSKAGVSDVYLKHSIAPPFRLLPQFALSTEFCSSCVSLTHSDTHTKKLTKSQKKTKQSKHHAENLERKLQVVFAFHVITIAFSKFKIQFSFKSEKENYRNNVDAKQGTVMFVQ